jgi:hypothetical protein
MTGEFWVGFYYGALAAALPLCGIGLWYLTRRVDAWMKMAAVVVAADTCIAAADVLADTPVGEFTGNEMPAYEKAEASMRQALAALKGTP